MNEPYTWTEIVVIFIVGLATMLTAILPYLHRAHGAASVFGG